MVDGTQLTLVGDRRLDGWFVIIDWFTLLLFHVGKAGGCLDS